MDTFYQSDATLAIMRIIGGKLGGRKLNPPNGLPARPTTDIAKEALFNTLANMIDIEGISACELFGGTGNISFELASRGATNVTIVERDFSSISFIKKTAKEFAITSQLNIIKGDALRFIKQNTAQFNFIFADPPYALANMNELPDLVFTHNMLAEDGLFILEHTHTNDFSLHPHFLKMKRYGTTIFSFFTLQS